MNTLRSNVLGGVPLLFGARELKILGVRSWAESDGVIA
jgi:hypothetical protein